MTYLQDILDQPENIERVGRFFAAELRKLDLSRFEAGSLVFTGMGSSYFASLPAVFAARRAGRRAFALTASELLESGGDHLGDCYVGISQSGKSAETVRAFSQVEAPRLSLTNDGGGLLAEVSDQVLAIGSGRDTAVAVKTHTATICALACLVALLLGEEAPGMDRLPTLMGEVLEDSSPVAREVAETFAGMGAHPDFVGRGVSFATAEEAALLFREVTREPAASLDTLQYLHGPIEVAGNGYGCVIFGSGREVRLAEDLASYGATVLLVTTSQAHERENLRVVHLPQIEDTLLPVLEILPVQLLAYYMARARGLQADGFRHHQPDTKLAQA
ncbi:SIS domain-containing protein [Rubrobacter calidifluminis]|uniref:SIS domain-containing protein n=1 Tax=Rubrobacter calidifluminis TaxID=1392640 RepID=UPI00235FCDF5|nr:hypothetical protein [Rubrobacter calidifluminis]